MSAFNNASNFVIHVGIFNATQGESGVQFLHQAAVTGAAHDSEERYPPPRCHPETRTAIVDDITSWVSDKDKSCKLFWLYGPAGVGKSAIAQTVSESCESIGQLAATFFFSRVSPNRNNAKSLFATVASQLASSIPSLLPHIENAVARNPSILTKSVDVQFRKLILKPLQSVSPESFPLPMVIIIDGLDECDCEDTQEELIELIATATTEYRTPICFIIASRPEQWIKAKFDSLLLYGNICYLFLEHTETVDDDIRIFLRAGFSRIQDSSKHRPTMRYISKPWPSNAQLKHLVEKADGQFVYASTVLKYVGDPFCRPDEQLQKLMRNIDSQQAYIFSPIDTLYHHILSFYPDKCRTQQVLGALVYITHFLDEWYSSEILFLLIDQLLDLPSGEAEQAMRGIHALCCFPEMATPPLLSRHRPRVQFYHKSILDFFEDESRSHGFYINPKKTFLVVMKACLKTMANPPRSKALEDYILWTWATSHFIWVLVDSSSGETSLTGPELSELLDGFDYQRYIDAILREPWAVPSFIHQYESNEHWVDFVLKDSVFIDELRPEQYVLQTANSDMLVGRSFGAPDIRKELMSCLDQAFIRILDGSPDPQKLRLLLALPFYETFIPLHWATNMTQTNEHAYRILEPFKYLIEFAKTDEGYYSVPSLLGSFFCDPERSRGYFITSDDRAYITLSVLHTSDLYEGLFDGGAFYETWTENLKYASASTELVEYLIIISDALLHSLEEPIEDLHELEGQELKSWKPINWVSTIVKWLQYHPNIPQKLLFKWQDCLVRLQKNMMYSLSNSVLKSRGRLGINKSKSKSLSARQNSREKWDFFVEEEE